LQSILYVRDSKVWLVEWFQLVISTLAVWRVTHLFQAEDGPWDVIFRIRKLLGKSIFGTLMDCFYCLSVWFAMAPGFYFGRDWVEKIILWLGISGGAIILERISFKEKV
jgi:hypothetical protein